MRERKKKKKLTAFTLSFGYFILHGLSLCIPNAGFFSDNTTTNGTHLPRLVLSISHAPYVLFLWQHHDDTVKVLLWSIPFSGVWLLCFLVFFLQKNSNLPLCPSLPATPHDTPPSSSGASHFSDCRSTKMSWSTTLYASLIQRSSTINMYAIFCFTRPFPLHWRSIVGSFLALGSCCCCQLMKLKELGWLFCFIVSVIRCLMILWNDLSVGKATTVVAKTGDYCVNISNISNFSRWWFGSRIGFYYSMEYGSWWGFD